MKNLLPVALCLFTSIVVLSCSSAPPTGARLIEATKNVKLPAYATSHNAIVYIVRPGSVRKKSPFDIYVDNPVSLQKLAGSLKGEEYIYFYLRPGMHRIFSCADNAAWLDVHAERNTHYFIQQIAEKGIARGFSTLKYIDIYTGKWYIKKMAVGALKNRFQ